MIGPRKVQARLVSLAVRAVVTSSENVEDPGLFELRSCAGSMLLLGQANRNLVFASKRIAWYGVIDDSGQEGGVLMSYAWS